jgi:hypothetical protein
MENSLQAMGLPPEGISVLAFFAAAGIHLVTVPQRQIGNVEN